MKEIYRFMYFNIFIQDLLDPLDLLSFVDQPDPPDPPQCLSYPRFIGAWISCKPYVLLKNVSTLTDLLEL